MSVFHAHKSFADQPEVRGVGAGGTQQANEQAAGTGEIIIIILKSKSTAVIQLEQRDQRANVRKYVRLIDSALRGSRHQRQSSTKDGWLQPPHAMPPRAPLNGRSCRMCAARGL